MSSEAAMHAAAAEPIVLSWSAGGSSSLVEEAAQHSCPWPEWHDAYVNDERWGQATAAAKSKAKISASAVTVTRGGHELFDDPMGRAFLPPEVQAARWVRLSQYFPTEKIAPTMFDDRVAMVDMLSANRHLLQRHVYRQMVTALHALCELKEPGLLPWSPTARWRPWSLVYSLCRSGPNVPHQPAYNASGKYLVRLFALGSWRVVLVDDWCPLDELGRPLLLRSNKLTEVWPLILSKAMLQVLKVGDWHRHLSGHELVVMLTGSTVQRVPVRRRPPAEIWTTLSRNVLARYEWPVHMPLPAPRVSEPKVVSPPATAKKERGKRSVKPSKKSPEPKRNESSRVSAKLDKHADPQMLNTTSCRPFVMAMVEDIAGMYCEPVETPLKADMAHLVLVSQYRDIPVEEPIARPPTPPWMNIRRHVWDPDVRNPPKPIKTFEVCTPLLDADALKDHTKNNQVEMCDVAPSGIVRDSPTSHSSMFSGRTAPTLPSSVQSLSNLASYKVVTVHRRVLSAPAIVFTSIKQTRTWMHVDDFCKVFSNVYIFYPTGVLPYQQMVLDIKASPSAKEKGRMPNVHTKSRMSLDGSSRFGADSSPHFSDGREPLYLFSDSIAEQLLHFNLYLSPAGLFDAPSAQHVVKVIPADKLQPANPVDPKAKRSGCVVLLEYGWSGRDGNPIVLTMSRPLLDSQVFRIPSGRHVFQLQILAGHGYALRMSSDSRFSCGTSAELFKWITQRRPLRSVIAGRYIVEQLLKSLSDFCSGNTSCFPDLIASFMSHFCPDCKPEEKAIRCSYQNMLMSSIAHVLPDFIEAASDRTLYAWRYFLLDVGNELRSSNANSVGERQLKKATPVKKEGNRKSLAPSPSGNNVATTSSRKSMATSGRKSMATSPKQQSKIAKQGRDRKQAKEDYASKLYDEEIVAKAQKIQNGIRRILAKRMVRAHRADSDEHRRVSLEINRSISQLQSQSSKLADVLLEHLLVRTQHMSERYLFYTDLLHTASVTELKGSCSELERSRWTLVFWTSLRVMLDSPVLVRAFVQAPFATRLRVLDLSSGEQVPLPFHGAQSLSLTSSSSSGYVVVAEGLAVNGHSCPAANWSAFILDQPSDRVMFANTPSLEYIDTVTKFNVNEVCDYYVPQEDGVLFQYYMRAAKGHQVTLQLESSHRSAIVSLEVLDNNGKQVAVIDGIGSAVVPFLVLEGEEVFVPVATSSTVKKQTVVKETGSDNNNVAPSRKSGGKPQTRAKQDNVAGGRSKPKEKARSSSRITSVVSSAAFPSRSLNLNECWDRYSVTGRVKASTWPLSESQRAFAQRLKRDRLSQQYVFSATEPGSPPATPSKSPGRAEKEGDAARLPVSNSEKISALQNAEPVQTVVDFDVSRPHFAVRFVSPERQADDIEVLYNTDFIESIRIQKLMREASDPQRSVKARDARAEYLERHMLKVEADIDSQKIGGSKSKDSFREESRSSPTDKGRSSPTDKIRYSPTDKSRSSPTDKSRTGSPALEVATVLAEFDESRFILPAGGRPRLMDADFMQEQHQLAELQTAEFDAQWQAVEKYMAEQLRALEDVKLAHFGQLVLLQKEVLLGGEVAHIRREVYMKRVADQLAALNPPEVKQTRAKSASPKKSKKSK